MTSEYSKDSKKGVERTLALARFQSKIGRHQLNRVQLNIKFRETQSINFRITLATKRLSYIDRLTFSNNCQIIFRTSQNL